MERKGERRYRTTAASLVCRARQDRASRADRADRAAQATSVAIYSSIPYFLLKRSTRPALSTIFCFPV